MEHMYGNLRRRHPDALVHQPCPEQRWRSMHGRDFASLQHCRLRVVAWRLVGVVGVLCLVRWWHSGTNVHQPRTEQRRRNMHGHGFASLQHCRLRVVAWRLVGVVDVLFDLRRWAADPHLHQPSTIRFWCGVQRLCYTVLQRSRLFPYGSRSARPISLVRCSARES
jgi:hypothetical protein